MFDVVMPLFNKEKFVAAAIESVLAQAFDQWRLFIVDDGSTDGGAEVVRGYGDPRITLIEQANQGVGPARNAGIGAGQAEWIAFIDADDVWNAGHLEELDALRRSFDDALLIGCAFRRFSGPVALAMRSSAGGERRVLRYFAECARGHELFVTSSAAVRRSALEAVGDFKPLPGNEDVELWARLALHGHVAVSSKPTVNYRIDTGGITDSGREESPKPTRRQDFSSTIPTLEHALPGVTDPTLRQDIIDYMDSRIGVRLVREVLDGDMTYARQVRTFYRGTPRGKARLAAAIARLPGPLARLIVRGGLLAKRRVRLGG
ncbi:MAG TPA: glycosyltransferase family A protein [Sphingomicrobium sp.]|jgi:glycosyltransferase involved in cell wall biosynthesis|nr:glycosyltransferase family A protein [Sphingomicrobium sp.]